MKNIGKILIITFISIVIMLVFFIFNVPDSTEARVRELTNEILYMSNETDSSLKFKEFMNRYDQKEKLEIFKNLPFSLVKDNRIWLVDAMNKVLPNWVSSDSFNSKYLLTELELEKKRNMRVIKNFSPLKKKLDINSLNSLANNSYELSKKNWRIDEGDFYVLDGSLDAIIKFENENYDIEKFKIRLFEIQNAYLFNLKYDKINLTISPSLKKFEDNGAFELSEKLAFYEIERLKKYLEKKYSIKVKSCMFKLSDTLINKSNNTDKDKNIEYLNLLYNRSNIKIIDKIDNLRYVGSIKIELLNASPLSVSASNKKGNDIITNDKVKKLINKQWLLNLFKDI